MLNLNKYVSLTIIAMSGIIAFSFFKIKWIGYAILIFFYVCTYLKWISDDKKFAFATDSEVEEKI